MERDLEQAFQYCGQVVREADKDRFLATLFAPETLRGPLYALYAFDSEIAQVRDRINTPLPGEVRLQWWRDVLTASGNGEVNANPVAEALLSTVQRYELPRSTLIDLIDARTFDLYDDPMATLVEFEGYAEATTAAVIGLAARILNSGMAPPLGDAILHAGVALALAAALLRLPLHSARGQCYLPGNILAAHGADHADLFAGRATSALGLAVTDLRAIARRHADAVRAVEDNIPPNLLPAFLPLSLVPPTLRRMEDVDPFRPQPLPQWRRQWIMWRAACRPAQFLR